MKVWVVGQSDDYIAAVFTDEERAREAVEKLGGAERHWWYDEVELDPDEVVAPFQESRPE